MLSTGALRKELHIAPFVEHFKAITLGINFAGAWKNLLKHCITVEFLLMECYLQGALRENLHLALFVERFKTTTLGKSH